MKTITLKVDDSVFDKFQWLISHFSKNEISMVNEIDITRLDKQDFDYISKENLDSLTKISNMYKNGDKKDFEEYKF
ncbi:hypothetical protein [Aliarcobacter butzleri]|uniref:hypothetical protein n=1 Tax=Aliarcobacter butzleri TaxID=28197 RepID=UPI001ED9D0A2|nr:hypothetical protein [Aliarcobacter butzleri]MCG3654791.1 hypothetical protein [Aliarcobacter butzleri]